MRFTWALAALAGHRPWWGNATLLALYGLALAIAHDTGSRKAWLGALTAILLTAMAAWAANLRRHRLIEDIPTSRIASAAQGYTELVGRSEQFPDTVLPARLSGRPCVWYRYQIETRDSGGHWQVEAFGTSDDSFLLRDETGVCVIDPEGAEVTTSRRRVWTEGRERFTEWLILPGDPLYAMGEFRTLDHDGLARDTRREVGELLAEWKREPQALLRRFDANGDGKIDLAEWEVARRAAEAEVAARERERASAFALHLMAKPRDGRPYLLSNVEPRRLVRRYRLWSFVHLAAFLGALGGLARWL